MVTPVRVCSAHLCERLYVCFLLHPRGAAPQPAGPHRPERGQEEEGEIDVGGWKAGLVAMCS